MVEPASTYDDLPCGYLCTSMSGTIRDANRAFLEWAGYRRDQLVNEKRFADLLTGGGRIYHETHYAPLLRMQKFAREIALDFVAADGRRLPALINAVVATDEAGDDVVRVAVFAAPDRREYERELVRARQRAEESEARATALAKTLQASLIPPAPPVIPAVDLGAAFRPAGSGAEVGGDFYDAFEITGRDWAVVIGDVCGKGVEAAVVTALARHTVRAAAMNTPLPRTVLETLNRAMLRQSPERFCTVAYSSVSRVGVDMLRVSFSSGGHPLPVYVPAEGAPRAVGEPGTALGIVPDPELYDTVVALGPGDALTFFTDGVTEGRSGGEFFGESRLKEVLDRSRAATATAIAEAVVEAVVAFQGAEPRDDIAVVVLKNPAGAGAVTAPRPGR